MGTRTDRYKRVFSVLARHGFQDIVATLSGKSFIRVLFGSKAGHDQKHDRWVRLRMVLEELGPAWVKFGQILSNRPGLLPDELTEELSRLQDAVAPFSQEEVEAVIFESFGQTATEIFAHFEPHPVASASIAQVHRATLKTGEQVAVKIQRPGIEDTIKGDLLLMRDLAFLMMRSKELASIRPIQLVEVFEKSILAELDFIKEQQHLKWFAQRFANHEHIKIPQVYSAFSNNQVVTLEYIEGIKIRNTEQLTAEGYDLKLLAKRGFEAYFTQLFEWGYFHADPHPGNLLILPGNVIGILDFGMVGRLNNRDRYALTEFIIGLSKDDVGRIVENIERLQGKEVENRKELEKDIVQFIDDFGSKSAKDLNFLEALNQGRRLIYKHNLELNPDLYLMLRTLSLLEGLGMTLDPELNSLNMVKPYAFKMLRKMVNPLRLARNKNILSLLADSAQLALTLPGDVRYLLEKLKNEELKIQTESKSTRMLAREVSKAGKRISYAMLTATCLLAGLYIQHEWMSPIFYFTAASFLIAIFRISRK